MNRLLSKLTTSDFLVEVGFSLPPQAMRRRLEQLPECRDLTLAYKQGRITGAEIAEFLDTMLKSFTFGKQFKYDVVFALLAVSLCSIRDSFTNVFLSDLASITSAELQLSPRIAKDCLTTRSHGSMTATRIVHVGNIPGPKQLDPNSSRESGTNERTTVFQAAA